MSSILKDVPKPIGEIRADLPRHLGRVIGRCLEKDRRDRYQTTRDVFNELKFLRREAESPGSGLTGIAIAVLPFADMSPAKDQDYFCEGMAEEIMNALVHVDGIRVASRNSAFRAHQEGKDLQEIGRALAVGQILEGSVRVAGGRLRVTAQLIDVETGFQLWSERYDREAEHIFAVQDEIAGAVVDVVSSRLASGKRTIQVREKVGNLEAYEYFLKGRYFRYSKNDHAKALKCFEHAVALDPSHAPSWVGLAEVKMLGALYNLIDSPQACSDAKAALQKAAQAQDEDAEALYVEGMIAYAERDWPTAEKAMRRALKLEPDHVRALCWGAMLLVTLRRVDEGLKMLEQARAVDPLAAYPYGMTGVALLLAGKPAEAEEFSRQASEIEETNTLALWGVGISAIALGRYDDGISALQQAVAYGRRGGFLLGLLGWALAAADKDEEAQAVLDELQGRPHPAPTVVPEAWLVAALGNHDEAWRVLDSAAQEKQAVVSFTEFPGYDTLRGDPRFAAFVESLGLPPSPSPSRR